VRAVRKSSPGPIYFLGSFGAGLPSICSSRRIDAAVNGVIQRVTINYHRSRTGVHFSDIDHASSATDLRRW
jgi:hypothetical protein